MTYEKAPKNQVRGGTHSREGEGEEEWEGEFSILHSFCLPLSQCRVHIGCVVRRVNSSLKQTELRH